MTQLFPQVQIFTNVIQSSTAGLAGELHGLVSYKQSYRANLGYYMCNLSIEDIPRSEMLELFYTLLGMDLKSVFGGSTVWNGMIYDIVLHSGSVSRLHSFDNLANSIKVTYIDTNGNLQTSAVAQQTQSIATHGRKEEIISMDSFDQTPAEQRRDQYLQQYAWPQPVVTGTNFTKKDRLEIVAVGYGWTLNWRYTTTADDSSSNASTWIEDIIDTDSEYVLKGQIEANALAVKQTVSSPGRCWDVIEQITVLGDSSNNFYQSYVDDGRRFYYRKLSKDPLYKLSNGIISDIGGSSLEYDSWNIRPAVFRDIDYISAPAEPGLYFNDARDFFVEEVEVSAGGIISLKTLGFDEVELLAARQEFQQDQERQLDSGSSSRDNKDRLNWKRKIGLSQEDWKKWEKMNAADRWQFRKNKIAEWKKTKSRKK